MIYLGVARGVPHSGWRLAEFANDWIAADAAGDPDGPLVFSPATVEVAAGEYGRMRASYRRFVHDPAAERETVGCFWDRWELSRAGRFIRRRAAARAQASPRLQAAGDVGQAIR